MFYDSQTPSLFDPTKEIAAVFIDFENMRLTVEEAGDEPFQMNKVLDYITEHVGQVAIKKAYSNWHYVNPVIFNLLGNNIDMIQIYPRGTQRKNAADIRLVADAMEILFRYPHIDTYVIVASDSDYTGLILKLREHGKKVVGIGTREHTSEHLVKACNLFRFYRTIATDDPKKLRATVGDLDFQEAKELLLKAMQRHRFTDRPAVGRWLRWQMIQIEPSFDEANYGFGTFREFLEACNDVVRVSEEGAHRDLKVGLLSRWPTSGEMPAEDEERDNEELQFEPVRATIAQPRQSGTPSLTITNEPSGPLPFAKREEDIKRSDYLRTLWYPRIYLYNRAISGPLIREIFRVNGPGKPLSQYDLEEHLLGPYADSLEETNEFPRFELTQKTIYAIQKLLFWAGTIQFVDTDELAFWKKRSRSIVDELDSIEALFEKIDKHLVRHFSQYLPLVPEVLATIMQGSESVEYAQRIVRAVADDPQDPEA
ncbi:MAG TPA: NYN domain-containing protein [bacterium]|nr:NYN domain-containing protein [bacterium]